VKFKLDENLPTELVTDLRQLDNDADTVADENSPAHPMPRFCERQMLLVAYY
jgi:hypothetical protein